MRRLLAIASVLALAMTVVATRAQEDAPPAAQAKPDLPKTERIPQPPVHRVDAPATAPAPPAFLIGVWYQPVSSFETWKARGINVLVGYESEGKTVSCDDYSNAARDAGLFMVREPDVNIIDDAKRPFLLGWMHHDEPDVRKPPTNPDDLGDDYAQWKKYAKDKPVFLNVSGGNVLFDKVPRDTYKAYCKSADWIGNDLYPVTGWNRPDWLGKVGEAVDQLRELSGGKPQIAFIECSNQHLAWLPADARGPTAGEMRAEIWDAIVHGAMGIVYFPQQMGNGFQFDAMPIELTLEMTRQNRSLTELAPTLARPANPQDAQASAAGAIEVGTRKDADGRVTVIAVNLSGDRQMRKDIKLTGVAPQDFSVYRESRTVTLFEGSLEDDFAPFAVHIYQTKAK